MTREQAYKLSQAANQEAFAPSLERRVLVRYRRFVAGFDGSRGPKERSANGTFQDVYACVDSAGRYHDLTPRQLRYCTYTDRDGKPIPAPDVSPRPACKFCDGSEPCGWCDKAPLRTS